jgi:hypothetical protein
MSSVSIEPIPDKFGKEGVEAFQGYSPMEPVNPVEKELDIEKPIAQERAIAYEDHLKQLDRDGRPGEDPVDVVREYKDTSGRKLADNLTVNSARQAAHDLTNIREAEQFADQARLNAEIAAAIEDLKAGDRSEDSTAPEYQRMQVPGNEALIPEEAARALAQEHQRQPQPEQQQPQQPEPNAVPEGDEVARALQSNPALLESVRQVVAHEQSKSQAAMAEYAQASAVAAQLAAAGAVSEFPELSGLHSSQFPLAIQVVAKSDPARAVAIKARLDTVAGLVQESARMQQAQAVQHQAHFQNWATQQDAVYDAYANSQVSSPAERGAIEAEALSLLREGGNEQQIWNSYNYSQEFRSATSQKALFDAARFRLSQKAVKAKQYRPVPNVRVAELAKKGNCNVETAKQIS